MKYHIEYFNTLKIDIFVILSKPGTSRILNQCRISINQGLGAFQMLWSIGPIAQMNCQVFVAFSVELSAHTLSLCSLVLNFASTSCFVDFWNLKKFRLWVLIFNLDITRPKSVHRLNLLAFDFFRLPVFDTVFYAGQSKIFSKQFNLI